MIITDSSSCEENRKAISEQEDRVMWLLSEIASLTNGLTVQSNQINILEQRIAYLELPWWKKLWK